MGSGRKRKGSLLLEDALSFNHKLFLANSSGWLQDQIASEIHAFTSKWPSWMGGTGLLLSGISAESLVLRCMKEVEEQIRQLATRHSKYFWLCLGRRIPPWPEEDELESTQLLWRTTFELAILKYGSAIPDPFIKTPFGIDARTWTPISEEKFKEIGGQVHRYISRDKHDSPIVPATLTTQDWTDLHTLRAFAKLYYALTAVLRRVWKGEMLEITSNWIPATRRTQPVSKLIEIYDKRANEFSHFFTSLGHPIVETIQSTSGVKDVMFLLVPNAFKVDLSATLQQAEKKLQPIQWFPNYLPYPFDCAILESWFERYGSALESVFQCQWQHVFGFFYALSERLTRNILETVLRMRQDKSSA